MLHWVYLPNYSNSLRLVLSSYQADILPNPTDINSIYTINEKLMPRAKAVSVNKSS